MNFSLSVRAAEQHRRISRGYTLKNATTGILRSINDSSPLDCLEGTLQELENSFITFQKNFSSAKQVHESLNEFNKSFSTFLYGIKTNSHCIEFPEAPTKETFETFTSFTNFVQQDNENENEPTPISTPKRIIATPRTQTIERKVNTPTSQLRFEPIEPKTPTKPPPPKKRKMNRTLAIKTLIKKIVDNLSPKYRDQQQANRKNVENILRLLCLTRSKCTEYLNVLVNGNHVVKLSQKGQLFKLNSEKYSSIF
ncbi:6962_t:CDS:2 [Diversispora eburnea]|uniref:DASH complex subunit DAM1 n=1 Tax=Diversispora eburnea TaxID=1213867 RepID=A0A9N8V8Z4_9GLOM|nr:6962_t:CDS:2 [Diversispora eburnea]